MACLGIGEVGTQERVSICQHLEVHLWFVLQTLQSRVVYDSSKFSSSSGSFLVWSIKGLFMVWWGFFLAFYQRWILHTVVEEQVACTKDEEGKNAGKEKEDKMHIYCLNLLSQTQTTTQGQQIFLYCFIFSGGSFLNFLILLIPV